jgi:hypothetical protein
VRKADQGTVFIPATASSHNTAHCLCIILDVGRAATVNPALQREPASPPPPPSSPQPSPHAPCVISLRLSRSDALTDDSQLTPQPCQFDRIPARQGGGRQRHGRCGCRSAGAGGQRAPCRIAPIVGRRRRLTSQRVKRRDRQHRISAVAVRLASAVGGPCRGVQKADDLVRLCSRGTLASDLCGEGAQVARLQCAGALRWSGRRSCRDGPSEEGIVTRPASLGRRLAAGGGGRSGRRRRTAPSSRRGARGRHRRSGANTAGGRRSHGAAASPRGSRAQTSERLGDGGRMFSLCRGSRRPLSSVCGQLALQDTFSSRKQPLQAVGGGRGRGGGRWGSHGCVAVGCRVSRIRARPRRRWHSACTAKEGAHGGGRQAAARCHAARSRCARRRVHARRRRHSDDAQSIRGRSGRRVQRVAGRDGSSNRVALQATHVAQQVPHVLHLRGRQ